MNPRGRISPVWIILMYLLALALTSWLILQFQLPDNVLLLFMVGIVLAAYYYPRQVYLFLFMITLPVSILLVAQLVPGGWPEALLRVGFAAAAVLIISAITRRINYRREIAEAEVRKSREQYRSLLEDINDVAFILNLEGEFLYVSPAIARVSGYQVQELVGRSFAEFIHPDDLAELQEAIQTVYQGRAGQRVFRVLDRDASIRHVRTFSRPLYENDRLVGINGIMVDVTDIVLAHERLETRRHQLQLLNEITRAALAESRYLPMVHILADRLAELFYADRCEIVLWNKEWQTADPLEAESSTESTAQEKAGQPLKHRITRQVLEMGRPLVVDDLLDLPSDSSEAPNGPSVNSMLALPLSAERRWLGAALIAYNESREFTEEEIRWAGMVSAQLSLAVYKGWALEAERTQQELASALREAGISLSGTLNTDEILDRLLPQVHNVVAYDCGVIMWIEDNQARVVRQLGYQDFYSAEVEGNVVATVLTIDQTANLRQMLEQRQPLVIPDVRASTAWHFVPGVTRLGSWVGIPILVKGEMIALYSLEHNQPGYFQPEHVRLLEAFAAQASLALENARLYEQARHQMAEAETLRQVSSAVVSELDLEKVLNQILEQLEKVVPYDSASVFIVEGDFLQIAAARGFAAPEEVVGLTVPRASALFTRINEIRGPLILSDAAIDPRFQGWGGTGEYVRGWMGVPLIVQGEIIGELTMDSRKVNAYDMEAARLVMDFATEASIAIQHARLYRRQLKTSKRLSILHQASQQVSASLDPLQLYQAVHNAASQVMSTESFVIAIQDDYGNAIEVPYLVDRLGVSESITIPHGSGLSGYIIRSGKSILVPDAEVELEFDFLQFGDPSPIRSFLAVPLRRQDGGVFGMVSAQSYESNAYDRDDLELLELLAAHASIALDNTRLFGELQRLAIIDELTGLFNRRHIFEVARLEFERARRYRRPLSIIMVDIDHFKQVNDQYGHLVGDQVLRIVANRCQENVRESDVVGRYGGEEFIILLPETGPDGAGLSAERLRVSVAEGQILARGQSVQVTVSVGVASLDADCTDLDHLISMADESLYLAKARGRNAVG